MEQKPSLFSNLMFIFPVMFYYALEALVVSIFITGIWALTLRSSLGHIGYFQVVGVYWIFKMLMFDVFKLITGLSNANTNIRQDMEENPENYNEPFEE